MKDFEMRYVGSHVEVYSGSGAFLFSADTVREAMEELAEKEAAFPRDTENRLAGPENSGHSVYSSCKKQLLCRERLPSFTALM